ncbi:MAG: EF0163 family protein [Enterococcus malodoratus]
MDKEKVKRVAIFLGVVCVVAAAFFWIENQRGHKNLQKEPATEESSNIDSTSVASSTKESTNTEDSTISQMEEQNMIHDFSQKLVNYDSVYKRNQSIKPLLTMKCIEENTINIDPHVDMKAKGKVNSVAADIKSPHSYTVLAEEEVNKNSNPLVITIQFNPQLKKIEKYEINYIRGSNQ